MFVAVGLQCAAVILFSVLTLVVSDLHCATSALLGGAAAAVPNGLFALRLFAQRGRHPDSYPAVFLVGEFLKIGLTAGLLAWIVHSQDVHWLSLILGLIVALKAPLLALLLVRDAPRDWPEYEGE
jgi:ATP synthase protein I